MDVRQKIGVAVVVGCLTVALLDVVLRLFLNGPVYQMMWPEIPQLSRFASDTAEDSIQIGDLGALTRDQTDDVPRRVQTTIDSFGFRNDAEAAQRRVDLIVLGDSFAFGTGTTQQKTMSRLFQDRYGLAVYNLSLPHSGPWEEFVNLTLESKRLRLREGATVLWLLFAGNDLEDPYGDLDVDRLHRSGLVGRMWTRIRVARSRSPLYQLLRRAKHSATGSLPPGAVVPISTPFLNGRSALFAPPYVEAAARGYEAIVAHANYPALKRTVAATKQFTDSAGASLKVVLIPTKEEVYGWMLDKRDAWSSSIGPSGLAVALHEICAGAGIDFLDLKAPFVIESQVQFARSGDMLWWYDDTHWNEHGHDLAASVIHREFFVRDDQSRQPPH